MNRKRFWRIVFVTASASITAFTMYMAFVVVHVIQDNNRSMAFSGERKSLIRQADTATVHDGVVMETAHLPTGRLSAIRYVELKENGGYGKLHGTVILSEEVKVGQHVHCEPVYILREWDFYNTVAVCRRISEGSRHKPHPDRPPPFRATGF